MQALRLGRSGLRISELALGTWTFGRETDAETAFAMLDLYAARGGTFLDTADAYNEGRSEQILGEWMRARANRDDVVLATKTYFPTGPGANDLGLGRKHIMRAIDDSLRRLGTDYIDLYQVHCWDPGVTLEETLSTLDHLVRAGKVRHLGVSNFLGWQIMKAAQLTAKHGWEPIVTIQNEYNLLSRGNELEVLPACRETGIALLPWSPLGGGWLTGKFRRGMTRPATGTRVAEPAPPWQTYSWEQRATERTWAIVDVVMRVAQDREVPGAQVALNWLRALPAVASPIVGARTMEQLDAALGCTAWNLEASELRELDEVSAVPAEYPYRWVNLVSAAHGRATP